MIIQAMIDKRALQPVAIKSLDFPASTKLLYVPESDPEMEGGNVLMFCKYGDATCMVAAWALRASDMLAYLHNHELMTRAVALRAKSPAAVIIIMGALTPGKGTKTEADGVSSGTEWRAVQGALLSVQELGVQVVTVQGERELGPTLQWLSDRSRGPIKVEPLRDGLYFTPGEAALLSMPGVGNERMNKLMAAVRGNPMLALLTLTDIEQDISGIPKKVQMDARAALGIELPDGGTLHIDWRILDREQLRERRAA